MKNPSIVLSFAKKILIEILSFIYPVHCLHCKGEVLIQQWLCSSCSSHLVFKESICLPYISTLEAEGPALSLLGSIKGSTAERMAKSMAALMVIQMDKIGLKMPDIIAVFPGQHDDFNVHLANSLGELLSVKVIEPIKAPSFLCPRYRWKGFYPLSNQRVFFIGLEKPKETECNMIDEAAPKEWIFFSVL